jgi:hypothetical protein
VSGGKIERPTTVYVARSASGIVLYVGITGTRIHRMHAHARASEWWAKAVSIELIHCATRAEAAEIEAGLIRDLGARFNIQHGTNGRRTPSEPPPEPDLLDLEALMRLGLNKAGAKLVLRSCPEVRRGRRRYVGREDYIRFVDEHTRQR